MTAFRFTILYPLKNLGCKLSEKKLFCRKYGSGRYSFPVHLFYIRHISYLKKYQTQAGAGNFLYSDIRVRSCPKQETSGRKYVSIFSDQNNYHAIKSLGVVFITRFYFNLRLNSPVPFYLTLKVYTQQNGASCIRYLP
jgi:hypothetical protein